MDIAPHVVYLSDSDKCAAITGSTLRVDGGFGIVSLAGSAGYKNK